MSVVAALILGAGIVMITVALRSLRLVQRVGRCLRPTRSMLIVEDDQPDRRRAAAGWLLFGMRLSAKRWRRSRRQRFERPVVADAMAQHIVADESVATAVGRFARQSAGAASQGF